MESQITSPSSVWPMPVKWQSAPLAPEVPQPRPLALPVHLSRNSLSAAPVMSTPERMKVDSVLVV